MSGQPTAAPLAEPAEPPAAPRRTARWCLGTRLLVGATALWLAFLLAHWLLLGRWWLWQLPEAAPPLTLLLGPLALLAAVRWARPVRRWLAPLQVLALLAGAALAGVVPGERPTGETSPTDLTVFVWNTSYWDMDKDPEALYAYLRARDADVYLLQEYLHWRDDGPVAVDATEELRARFPGYQVVAEGELLTLSRLPVVAAEPRPTGEGDDWYWGGRKAQRVDVRYAGRTVSLYNVHLQVPFRMEASPLSGAFYSFMRDQHASREREISQLRDDLAVNRHPRLVAGDLNSPWGHRDPDLGPGLRRQDPSGGPLGGFSWPVAEYPLPALWRLDWAYTGGEFTVTRHTTHDNPGLSDHRGRELWLALD